MGCQLGQNLVLWFLPKPNKVGASPFESNSTVLFPFEGVNAHAQVHGLNGDFVKSMLPSGLSGKAFASPEWVWNLGVVLVDGMFLFHFTDVPKLAVNLAFRTEYFYTYRYAMTRPNEVNSHLKHYLREDIKSIGALNRLSLVAVHQLWSTEGTQQRVKMYEAVIRKSVV
ncbi:hypothetical protein DYB37_007991 [Aphanomyces astaci]|uniref:Uncharacterized protein n=1 Tax=Aphanomyces astaci TaxID=112090 RepID=A0A3R7C8I9_APHAT|nr:hypothetical protein DYB35_008202 [Aphanomyces astaci]RHZ18391.1 hypothetical protein DYB37_007991 [Aphanomyces astaci]